jgi:hypothetical protein
MLEAEPRLLAWVARTTAMDALMARLGPRGGEVREMRRGDLHWRMALPPQRQDLDNLIPPMIEWKGERAGKRLRDSHFRLVELQAEHPEAEAVKAALAERGLGEALVVKRGAHPRLLARLRGPDGTEVTLTSG